MQASRGFRRLRNAVQGDPCQQTLRSTEEPPPLWRMAGILLTSFAPSPPFFPDDPAACKACLSTPGNAWCHANVTVKHQPSQWQPSHYVLGPQCVPLEGFPNPTDTHLDPWACPEQLEWGQCAERYACNLKGSCEVNPMGALDKKLCDESCLPSARCNSTTRQCEQCEEGPSDATCQPYSYCADTCYQMPGILCNRTTGMCETCAEAQSVHPDCKSVATGCDSCQQHFHCQADPNGHNPTCQPCPDAGGASCYRGDGQRSSREECEADCQPSFVCDESKACWLPPPTPRVG